MALPIAAAIIGAAASAAGNMLANKQAYNQQKELNQVKYEDMINYAHMFGATPSSIIQGITGSAGGAVPVVSASNNPVPDFGNTISNAVAANSSSVQAEAAKDQASAALTNAETERQLGLMKLKFEPQKYFADIRKSLSEAFRNSKEAFLHGSMKQYYDELATDIRQVRPWKIASLKQGLLNDMATFNKIVQETDTLKHQAGYYDAASNEANTRADLNRAETGLTYTRQLNESLQGFRLQWENDLISHGIDPTKPFFENTARLMYTNPRLFQKRMDMFISSLNLVDSKLQENLGDHYKRNIALGYGLYKLNDIYQKNATARANRFHSLATGISSFIPFAGGSSDFSPYPF